MRLRPLICMLGCAIALGAADGAASGYSYGTTEQVSWVRSAAARFVSAELAGNGAEACAVLEGRLRVTRHGLSCQRRWDARLHALLRNAGARRELRALRRAIGSAAVSVHGDLAWIRLPSALMDGPNRFRWTENCWMLEA